MGKKGGNVLEKLINASFGQASREEWAQYRPEVAEIFPRTRESHAGKRIGSAMRTIASPPPSPLLVEAIRDESPASMGAMG